MKTYWEFTERERAEMSEEQIKVLLDVELMTKGVLKVDPPTLRPIVAIELPTCLVFEIDGEEKCSVVFPTMEAANAFLALQPASLTYDWQISSKVYFAKPITGSVRQRQVSTLQGVLNAAMILKQNKIAEEENDKAQRVYSKACEDAKRVLDGVLEDWYACRELAARHKKIKETLESYRNMTEGRESMAVDFLMKAFPLSDIQAAEKWFDELWTTTGENVA